jgi:hypothetical protein
MMIHAKIFINLFDVGVNIRGVTLAKVSIRAVLLKKYRRGVSDDNLEENRYYRNSRGDFDGVGEVGDCIVALSFGKIAVGATEEVARSISGGGIKCP